MVRRVRPVRGLWLLVWAAVSGCSLHGQHAASNRFVKHGEPTVAIGEPIVMAKVPDVGQGSKGSSHAAAKSRPASSLLPTLENTDRALSAALLRAAVAPTPEAHRAVGDRYRALGILDMAYDHYLRASQMDRTDSAAYEGLARIWRDWGFPALGAADASRAVFYAPASASAHNTWGTVLTATGHHVDARREYERAVVARSGRGVRVEQPLLSVVSRRRQCAGGGRVPHGPFRGSRARGRAGHDGVARAARVDRARAVMTVHGG